MCSVLFPRAAIQPLDFAVGFRLQTAFDAILSSVCKLGRLSSYGKVDTFLHPTLPGI